MIRPAVFLDKDGMLVENLPHNVNPDKIRLLPRVASSLRRLHGAGFRLVVVSNQCGVARGLFPETALDPVAERIADIFEQQGAALAGFYYCPHHPDGILSDYTRACDCRKPNPGMLRQAASDLNLNIRGSWIVGNVLDDVEAGNRAGCKSILVNQDEVEWDLEPERQPMYQVRDLDEAARLIIAEDGWGAVRYESDVPALMDAAFNL